MNNASDFDTIVMDAADARRIAELEREVRQLRHVNEILKVHFAGELDFGMAGGRKSAEVLNRTPPDAPDAPAGVAPDAPQDPSAQAPRDTRSDAPREAWARPPWIPAPQPMAEFRVLGPIEAAVDGRVVDLGAPKQRAMLALLVSRAGQPVPVDLIVEELWTGRPPPSAITSLQAYVANLRRVLEPDRAPRTPARVLCTRGKGYLLDRRVAVVDARRFGERAASGWRALDRGDPQRALIAFEAGLALWRGQAYMEVADATYVAPEAARLEELRLSAIEGRCAALLAVGAHELAAAELEAFTQTHPLREYGYELLSLALYRSGRQADALAALRTNQQRLALELGIDPRPALQRLEKEILNQAPALDWHPPVPAAASGEPGHVPPRR